MVRNKKYAVITFDYEVFLGRKTGTINKCVIRPTEAILEILKKYNAKAIFFVDTTWLLFIKEYYPEDFDIVVTQLRNIILSGSSVELHLHPQWIDAEKTAKGIVFRTYKHYKLHSLPRDEINNLFSKSADLLHNITGVRLTCFRAGGWAIEPFTELKEAFVNNGLKFDFSVVPGMVIREGKSYDIDFSESPSGLFYRFEHDTGSVDPDGSFVEFPMSTFRNNPVYRVLNKVFLKISKDGPFGDGAGSKDRTFRGTLTHLLSFSVEKFSLDKTMNILFRFILRVHLRKRKLIVAVSHPKTASPEALRNLKFLAENYVTLNSDELGEYIKHVHGL